MEFEAVTVPAEGVGQDDLGTGIDKTLVNLHDPNLMLQVPPLGAVTRNQTFLEQACAHGTVHEHDSLR